MVTSKNGIDILISSDEYSLYRSIKSKTVVRYDNLEPFEQQLALNMIRKGVLISKVIDAINYLMVYKEKSHVK